eukprot:CAMPEP_0180798592 /NCGR_PEP_ID=MMETSP1038_2-20121128/58048_1 /TAXON_ID=632150 /ORGANISM="Azadinium spinosum, Strain 3D9" /LENGTH=44 /DNA_ID= /DNA_START= /DNA_END= /DNA_ORIENTATION=
MLLLGVTGNALQNLVPGKDEAQGAPREVDAADVPGRLAGTLHAV